LLTVLLSAILLSFAAIPASANAYSEYQHKADAAGNADYYNRVIQIAELITYNHPSYWGTGDLMQSLYDAIAELSETDKNFYNAYTSALAEAKRQPVSKETNTSLSALKILLNKEPAYFVTLVTALIALTDEFSGYLPMDSYFSDQGGGGIGIGIAVQNLGTSMLVTEVYADGGAAKAGIVKGDAITAVNGIPFNTFDLHYRDPLAGTAGTWVDVTLLRADNTTETVSVVRTTLRWVEFYKHESCGKCTPCREGSWWLVQLLRDFEAGQAHEGDIEKMLDLCDNVSGKSFCTLADGFVGCVKSAVAKFRSEFEAGYHTPAWELFPYERTTVWAKGPAAADAAPESTDNAKRGVA
jgi:hypothetical protein